MIVIQDWERAAVRELIDIVSVLCNSGFESRQAFLKRLTITRDAIELLESGEDRITWEPSMDAFDNVRFLQPKMNPPETPNRDLE
jgi:hypothetical protein